MTLKRAVRLVVTLLLVVACLPLLSSGELPWGIWAVVVPAIALGLVAGSRPWPRRMVLLVTTLLVMSFFLLLLLSIQNGQWLINSISFALLVTAARCMQLLNAAHYFQLIGLSFLLLIASAVTEPGISFGLFFLIYCVLLTWALTFVHLQQQVEESPEGGGVAWKASSFVSRKFLIGSSLLALALLLSSMVIFFLFPRLGLGFFSAQTRRGETITGFSDSIELGHFGNIEDSGRVLMRIQFPEGAKVPDPNSLHLRGLSFDTWKSNGWTRRPGKMFRLFEEAAAETGGEVGFRTVWGFPTSGDLTYDLLEYDIYQEPMDAGNRVLFTINWPLRMRPLAGRLDQFRGRGIRFFQDELLDLGYDGPSDMSMSYTVQSAVLRVAPQRLRESNPYYPQAISKRFLQLPDSLDTRIGELAVSAADGARNPYDKAVNIENYLKNNFGYTTWGEGEGPGGDAISHFLFDRRQGHCEYFASSMVLMLRTLGVPARPVNGFLGATWNEFGNFYTVTEGSAHSWVEVYFHDYGWLTFDPTPAVERLPEDPGIFALLQQWLDAMKLRWYQWIVEYDLEKQLAVYARLWNMFGPGGPKIEITPDLSVDELRSEMRKLGKELFSFKTLLLFSLTLLFVSLVWLALSTGFGRGGRRGGKDALARLALALRQVLARKGFDMKPGTTLQQAILQARSGGFTQVATLERLVDELETARWGPPISCMTSPLKVLLREVRRAPPLRRHSD